MLESFLREIKFAWQDFWRNFWLSTITVTILVLTLLSINLLFGLRVLTSHTVAAIEKKMDVSIYFKSRVPDEQVGIIRSHLLTVPGITAIEIVTADDALEQFRKTHATDPAVVKSLEEIGKNPFGASLRIKASSVEVYPRLLETLATPAYKDLVADRDLNDRRALIEKITSITKKVERFALALAVIFILISFLIIFNTIRVSIYTHRDEIGIMRLVGATNSFIRGPFLIGGILYCVAATIVAAAIVLPVATLLEPYFRALVSDNALSLSRYFTENFFAVFGLQLVALSLLTLLSTGLAVRRYMKV